MNGIYGKFYVRRVADHAGKHDHCRYFVLDPQHDRVARVALCAYLAELPADSDLARDLTDWIIGLEGLPDARA